MKRLEPILQCYCSTQVPWFALFAALTMTAGAAACVGTIGNPQSAQPGGSGPHSGSGDLGPETVADGGIATSADGGAAMAGDAGTGSNPAPLGTPTIARLSQVQYANSARDLLALPSSTAITLSTPDAVVRLDNEADSLFVSQDLHDDLQASAESLAAQIAGSTTAINKLIPANAPTDATGKATAFIQSVGRQAYRRPLTSDEVQSYLTLFNQGPTLTTGYSTFAAGVRVTLEAFLQSPYFLYRTGFGGAATNGRSRLTDYEIAANLAYALTNTTPDAALATAADGSQLETTAQISAQAMRLLGTTNGQAAVGHFNFQFFGLGQYDTLEKDPTVAPQFTSAVGPMLDSESAQFLQYIFSQQGTCATSSPPASAS